MSARRAPGPVAIGILVGLALVAVAGGLGVRMWLQSRHTATYEQTVRHFYRGLAALDTGLLDNATLEFTQATSLEPDEPATWVNLGVARIRAGEDTQAIESLQQAASLAPTSSDVRLALASAESASGQPEAAIDTFRQATALDPRNLKARYGLASALEDAGGAPTDAEALQQLDALLQLQPANLPVLLQRARLAAKIGNVATLADSIARLRARTDGWPPAALGEFQDLTAAVAAGDLPGAARATAFLRNVLVRVPAYATDLAAVRTPPELIAEPFTRFLTLPTPSARPAPADHTLAFASTSLPTSSQGPRTLAVAVPIDSDGRPALFVADGHDVERVGTPAARLPFPGGDAATPPSPSGVLALDWNHDFRTDLLLAGRGGLRLFIQAADGTFDDRTPDAPADAALSHAAAFGAWAADVEMDGDLDAIVGVDDAPPLVLRNNGDGTWTPEHPFAGLTGLRAMAWGDLDHDGDPDAVLLDAAGTVHVFINQQAGRFEEHPGPGTSADVVGVAVTDFDGNGTFDLVTLDRRGRIRGASMRDGGGWDERPIAAWEGFAPGAEPGAWQLHAADLDNNGALDLVVSGPAGSRAWLADAGGHVSPLTMPPDTRVFGVADLDGDGLLDLVGVSAGRPVQLTAHATSRYHWQVIRARAQTAAGDERINSFGVGGEVEVRSGLLVEKQLLTGAPAHFGLGAQTNVDVARIVWPNGVMQAEFDPPIDGQVVAEQRLKGSCPWVFTYDGTGMRFVTDFLWRSPLGLRINAQDTAGITQTEDWVKIRGDQLVARDGYYDVRITAELWETHFFDSVSLMAVDHPSTEDVFVDERFSSQSPPGLAVRTMQRPRAVARAWDDRGRDVTDVLAAEDGRDLEAFARGTYQGITRDHYVEFELGPGAPTQGPLWLLAYGWIYPTDSSINVAIAQGRHAPPEGLSLEGQDAGGHWVVIEPHLGFPAGKNKTILVDLGRVPAGMRARRFRLRTNLEVYWDWIGSAAGLARPQVATLRLDPSRAELRYRGFSRTALVGTRGPEVPSYDEIQNTMPRWRDLVGYYTRFGDVRELVGKVDDRYVIMNAGDELRLRFTAPPPPPPGWTRDFVLVGDGWVKDGDFNTSFSKTVGPLPSHDRPDYGALPAPRQLEDDPVYQRHPEDWQRYHTRYVRPTWFLRGLRAY